MKILPPSKMQDNFPDEDIRNDFEEQDVEEDIEEEKEDEEPNKKTSLKRQSENQQQPTIELEEEFDDDYIWGNNIVPNY